MEFLSVDEVLTLHAEQIERYGGQPGVRDPGLLASAVAIAQVSFDGAYLHEDVFAMASAYAFHIAENQPFLDGNKRAALAAALVFLELHGIGVRDPEGRLYDAMIALSSRALDKPGMASLLRELAEESPSSGG
jgi:death-on-curing protein